MDAAPEEAEMQVPEGDYDALIFDCDGTVADSMPVHFAAWERTFAEFGRRFEEDLFYRLGGMPARQMIAYLNDRFAWDLPVETAAARKEECYLAMVRQVRPVAPVVRWIESVRGRVPMAMASGGRRSVVERTLEVLRLRDWFSILVCSEDYRRGKPAPDPFLEAARRLGVAPSRCLVFEDTPTGLEAAEAAGMRWVRVPEPPRWRARWE